MIVIFKVITCSKKKLIEHRNYILRPFFFISCDINGCVGTVHESFKSLSSMPKARSYKRIGYL